jgi:hypothetical protein
MNAIRTSMVAAILAALGSPTLPAQSLPPGSGQIARVEGKVYLDQQPVEPASTPVWILNPNSVVRTEEGHAEVLLAGGVSLFLGENSAIKRVPSSPYNFSRFEPLSGSTIVTTSEWGSVATCENEVTLSDSGLYRFDVFHYTSGQPAEKKKLCGFRVDKGAAAVQLPSMLSVLRPGTFVSLNLDCGDRMVHQEFDPSHTDDLDHWSRERMRLRSKQ